MNFSNPNIMDGSEEELISCPESLDDKDRNFIEKVVYEEFDDINEEEEINKILVNYNNINEEH